MNEMLQYGNQNNLKKNKRYNKNINLKKTQFLIKIIIFVWDIIIFYSTIQFVLS